MKKLIISMFALAAVITSCSKSEVMDSRYENIPISFTTYNGRTPEVKATEVNTNNFEKFQVFAWHSNNTTDRYFNDNYLTGKGTDATEGFVNGDKYWPAEGTLDFFAFAPEHSTGENAVVSADVQNKKLTITVPVNAENHKDVVVATATDKLYDANTNGSVDLTFSHMLSRVHFAVESQSSQDIIIIHDIAIENLYNVGEIELHKSPISTSAITTNTAINHTYAGNTYLIETSDDDNKGAIFTDDIKNRYMMIIPQSASGSNISIKYTFNGNEEYKETAKTIALPADFEFTQGCSYLFKLTIKSNAIKFSVEVTGWDETYTGKDGDNNDIEIPYCQTIPLN